MRILDLAEFYSERGGGVRSYLGKLLAAADRAGHEVVVVAPGPKDADDPVPGGRIVRYPGPPMPYDPSYHAPIRVDRMRALVRAHAPDVLQVSSPFLPAAVAATLREIPVRSYVYHSDPLGCYVRPTARRLLGGPLRRLPGLRRRALRAALAPAWLGIRAVVRSVDVTVVAGHWLEAELRQEGCRNVVTVPFGISRGDLGPSRADPALRRALLGPLDGDPAARLVLITGRLAADKRQALSVEAVRRLARRRPLALVVLGDGPERPRLEALARELPMATFRSFTHDRAEYAAMLASVDALVHASLCETYGFVIAETLASGTPVVLPGEGGAGAFADPRATEAYDPEAGPDEVAAALDRLLDRDRAALGAAARRIADGLPTMDDHFDGLFGLYEGLLTARRAGRAAPWSATR
jgi:alpha-1,6-mannosyltransferase